MHPSLFSLPKKLLSIALVAAIVFTSSFGVHGVFAQSDSGGYAAGAAGGAVAGSVGGSSAAASTVNTGSNNGGSQSSGSVNPNTGTVNSNSYQNVESGSTSRTGDSAAQNEGNVNFEIEDKQATTQQKTPEGGTGANQGNTVQEATTDIVAGALTCSAAGLLGNLLSSVISAAISALITAVIGEVAGTVLESAITVPTNSTFDTSAQHQLGDARARSGGFTIFGIYINFSWDGIAWCIVNAMIEYIANATIAWANSGFNGNPAFIENPERFFKDLADYQAGSIIRDIAYGATGGAVNVCEPFRINIAVGLAQSYQGSGADQRNAQYRNMSCSLSDITQNRFFGGVGVSTGQSGFNSGSISWNDWIGVTQEDQNNPYGSYILANQVLHSSVSANKNELKFEVGLNNGWLNFKKCTNPDDPNTCNITTPGRLIESSLNQTLGLSKQRLVMAQKFDQMITAIVNNLIKIALDKVLESAEE